MKRIATAGNTVVPALLALEKLGFDVTVEHDPSGDLFRAARRDESFVADDPVGLLGLVSLVEVRGWSWQATDQEIDETLGRYRLA